MERNNISQAVRAAYFQYPANKWLVLILAIINACIWTYAALAIRPQADPIYLHYNIYFGVDLIGQWYRIFILPAAGLLIGIIHLLLGRFAYKKNLVLSYVIIWLAILLQIILLLSIHLIIRQN